MIHDQEFSDVIFTSAGVAMLKGVPGHKGVVPAPLSDDLHTLRKEALKATGSRLDAFLRFEGVPYRVKRMESPEGEPCLYLRRAVHKIPPMMNLGYGAHLINRLCAQDTKAGLVLFAGSQGEGKTTGASAFVKERLIRLGGTAITVECPIELPLDGMHGDAGWCQQTEVASENLMGEAVAETYRCSSPDILFLGEIREGNVAVEAMRAAITSYIVVTTIHADSIVSAVQRIIMFALERLGERPALELLSQAYLCGVHQRLVPCEAGRRLKCTSLFREQGVISKLAKGNFAALKDEIDAQRNRLAHSGVGGPRRVK